MPMTVNQLMYKLEQFVAEDAFRGDMRVTDGDGKDFKSLDVQRDKHGLAILVLDSAGVRID